MEKSADILKKFARPRKARPSLNCVRKGRRPRYAAALLALAALFVLSCENLADSVEPSSEWYVSLPAREGPSSSAYWSQSDVTEYTVTLSQDGRSVFTRSGSPGSQMSLRGIPPGVYDIAVEGLNADGDTIADGGGTVSLESGKTADVSITLTMRSNDNKYIVSYDANSGGDGVSGTVPAAAECQYRDTVTVQFPALSRTGYDFDGWNTAADGSGAAYRQGGTETFEATAAVTLYAQWNARSYTIAFSAGTGVSVAGTTASMSMKYDQEKSLSANGFSRAGYDFAGWSTSDGGAAEYSDGQAVKNLSSAGGAAVTLYAVWLAHTDTRYTVEHYKQNAALDGYLAPETETKTGTTGTQTEAAARTYVGFETPAVTQETIKADGSAVIRLYYNRSAYTVTFDGNGSAGGSAAAQTFYYGSAQALNANGFTKTGHSFAGWAANATSAAQYADAASYTVGAADATLYAAWSAKQYAVALSAPDATTAGTAGVTATYGSAMPAIPLLPRRAGYAFAGFFTAANGGGTQYYSAAGESMRSWNVAADTTLYAHWAEATDTKYTVEHYKQDTTGSGYTIASSDTQVLKGTTGASTAATAKSYTGFETPAVAQKTIAADGSTVVKIYYDRKTFAVTYSAGSGATGVSGMPAAETHRYGASVAVANEEPSRSGYAFNGWILGSDAATRWKKGETISNAIAEDLALTAVWSAAGAVSVEVANSNAVSASKDSSGNVVTLTLNGATALVSAYTTIEGAAATSKTGVSISGNKLVCDTSGWTAGSYQATLYGTVNGIPQSAVATIIVE